MEYKKQYDLNVVPFTPDDKENIRRINDYISRTYNIVIDSKFLAGQSEHLRAFNERKWRMDHRPILYAYVPQCNVNIDCTLKMIHQLTPAYCVSVLMTKILTDTELQQVGRLNGNMEEMEDTLINYIDANLYQQQQ